MATDNITADMKKAAAIGMIELLIQPDAPLYWVREEIVKPTVGDTPVTDEVVEQVQTLMEARLKELARTLLAELDAETRADYEKIVFNK